MKTAKTLPVSGHSTEMGTPKFDSTSHSRRVELEPDWRGNVLPVQKEPTPACHQGRSAGPKARTIKWIEARGEAARAISIRKKWDRRWHREWRYSPGLSRGLLPIQRRLAPAAGGSPTGPQGGAPWDPKGKDRAASDPNQKIEKRKTTKRENNVIEK